MTNEEAVMAGQIEDEARATGSWPCGTGPGHGQDEPLF